MSIEEQHHEGLVSNGLGIAAAQAGLALAAMVPPLPLYGGMQAAYGTYWFR